MIFETKYNDSLKKIMEEALRTKICLIKLNDS